MQEKRQYKRFRVDIMEINGRMTFARDVKILNISIGGVSIKADRRLNINNEYTLKIEGKKKSLTVKGIVVWSLISGSTQDFYGNFIPIYTAGMKFTELSDAKKIEIITFLQEHKIDADKQVDMYSPNGLRLYVRIHIEAQAKAILNFQEDYKVKKISLGGMLIESEHVLELESKIEMEITLNEGKTVYVLGRVASCLLETATDLKHCDIGIEFLEMPDNDREILNGFIRLLNNESISSSSL